ALPPHHTCTPATSLTPPRHTPFPYTTLFRSSHYLPCRRAISPTNGLTVSGSTCWATGLLPLALWRLSIDFPRSCWCSPPSSGSRDRKSTRLNSSHVKISYAVFCVKKKKCQT